MLTDSRGSDTFHEPKRDDACRKSRRHSLVVVPANMI